MLCTLDMCYRYHAGWFQFTVLFRIPPNLWCAAAPIRTSVLWTSSWHCRRGVFRSFDVWFLVNKGECDVHARKDTNYGRHHTPREVTPLFLWDPLKLWQRAWIKPNPRARAGKGKCEHVGLRDWLVCVHVCVCVVCIQHSWALSLGSNKQDKTVSEGKKGNIFRGSWIRGTSRQTRWYSETWDIRPCYLISTVYSF